MTDELASGAEPRSSWAGWLGRLSRLPRPGYLLLVAATSAAIGGLVVSATSRPVGAVAGLSACRPTPVPSGPPGGSLNVSRLARLPTQQQGYGLTVWPAAITSTGLPFAGRRAQVRWTGSQWPGVNVSNIAFEGPDPGGPMMLSFETSDRQGSALTALYFTEPREQGTSTAGIRLQAPLPWMALQAYQTAVVYSYDCQLRVVASRPTAAHRWMLHVAGNASTRRPKYFVPTDLVMQTDSDQPPFHHLQLDLMLSGDGRTAHVHLVGPSH
jgi:hypothetical protein